MGIIYDLQRLPEKDKKKLAEEIIFKEITEKLNLQAELKNKRKLRHLTVT